MNKNKKKIIEVCNLTKEYKNKLAIDDLSFDVYKGEILGLLGPNGSGKSTCINSILSLLKYQKGTIKIFGEEMKPDSYDIKEKIGVIFQDVAVFDELNVYDNINYFCGLYIQDKKIRKQYVEEAIELVGLGEFKKFLPKQLSGGLLRRLNIACGIAHKPKLIFLDEPTVAVDPQSRNNILDGIKKLRDNGATIVYTTHYMEEAAKADYIIIMNKGKIEAKGTTYELKEKYTKDKMIVYTKNNSFFMHYLSLNNYNFSVGNNNVIIDIENTLESIKILENCREYIESFEVIKGSMDDVFINITRKGNK